MNRIKSGVPGLDDLIEGGFPESSSILVSGGPGCGKSILCMQFLYNGAKLYGEKGAYITLEEGAHNLWWNMQRFKWDLLPLEKENMLKIYKFEPSIAMKDDIEGQTKRILEKAKEMGAKRLVIDSITAFSLWLGDVTKIRLAMYYLIEELRKMDVTTILTCETSGKKDELSRFGVEEFLTDGVIMMYFFPPHRSIFVRKMRGTANDKAVHPFEISDRGIEVNSREELLWESLR
ncbi:AAA family ATPase [Candidatus Micrarchaeota archaeon]|nr:AAA family ATPase [Candidatus Micrarchaeota archaeon]